MFAYVGAFTTPERKGHGDGTNVYGMDAGSGGRTHVQLPWPICRFSPWKGLDRVFSFRLDGTSGKLTPNDPPFVATREGAGPRHMRSTRACAKPM
jgi:hypothetical protein